MNQAVRQDATNARALYLRARAKESAGQQDAAIADYNLAARNALAKAEDQAGEAHLYRGISLYRRKEYAPAEDEFTNALNFNISAASRADAVAWRSLAAVAVGQLRSGPEVPGGIAPGGLAVLPARRSAEGDRGVHRDDARPSRPMPVK